MKRWGLIFAAIIGINGWLMANTTETITIDSKAFNQKRAITIHLPADFKYQSALVRLPVIYVLDAQHEWFANPMVNNIKYLKTTYEVPNAIIVEIPLVNRNKECAIRLLDGETLPLHRFITKEIEEVLQPYHPNDYRMLIGHSFSASFALYSYLRGDGFYSAVIAHSPLDRIDELVSACSKLETEKIKGISLSYGSQDFDKDRFHREAIEALKKPYAAFFETINYYESNTATHNAIPIISNPLFLSQVFYPFSRRFGQIARVDMNYQLVAPPSSVDAELKQIEAAATLGDNPYPPEIGEYFGIASRYQNSNYNDHAAALFQEAIRYYPTYYDLHVMLYTLLLEKDKALALEHLKTALKTARAMEHDNPDYDAIIKELKDELASQGIDEI